MVNLNETPDEIFNVTRNQKVIVDGHVFIVEEPMTRDGIYLTAVDPAAVLSAQQLSVDEDYEFVHLRHPDNWAVMSYSTIHNLLVNRTYVLR